MVIAMGICKLEIRNLCKSFGENQVLKNVSFEIAEGEFVAVMGQSGCGKSTLLYCVSGMEKPTSGEIIFEGREFHTLPGFYFSKTQFPEKFGGCG